MFIKIISFIDFRVLAQLLCLMLVVAGFQKTKVFDALVAFLLHRIRSFRMICMTLVLLCFFTSMLVTNDVALITFVPFAMMVLNRIGREQDKIFVLVMQTVAANLGSMATPIGNPQNLYLYSLSGMGFGELAVVMLPYVIAALAGIIILILVRIPAIAADAPVDTQIHIDVRTAAVYGALFAVCMLCVLHIIIYPVMLVAVLGVIAVMDWRLLLKADYQLLVTFIVLFVIIGFLKDIEAVRNFLGGLVAGNEVIVSVVTSQVISNVPAAVLLSAFTNDYRGLLVGTNIGGLGTLIASMASLITYRLYKKQLTGKGTGRYMAVFTGINLLFLGVMLLLRLAIGNG